MGGVDLTSDKGQRYISFNNQKKVKDIYSRSQKLTVIVYGN